MVKVFQSEFGSNIDKDGVKGDIVITPRTEWRQAGASRTTLMQAPITRGIEGHKLISNRVFDYQGLTLEVMGVKDDKFIFPSDSLGGICQHRAIKQW